MAFKPKTAFLTGANVGQSNLLVKALAGQGWHVFAGVLPGAPTDLVSGSHITVVEQDVSRTDSVKRSAETVQAALGERGFRCCLVGFVLLVALWSPPLAVIT